MPNRKLHVAALLLAAGCSSSEGAGVEAEALPNRCAAPVPLQGPAFRESTAGRGLDGVEGLRLSAVDLDGDGLAELIARRVGTVVDDFSPGGTRAVWVLHNEGGRFVDVTESSGLLASRTGSGTRPAEVMAFADVDGDGDLDAYTGFTDPDKLALHADSAEIALNDGTGHFSLGPAESDLRRAGQAVAISGASFTDFDRDGRIDLWVGNGSLSSGPTQDHLYRGNGDGSFVDVTRELGLQTRSWRSLEDLDQALAHSNAWSTAACDLNDDGWPELLAASYGRAPNHLWQGTGSGYLNRSIASGYAFDERTDWTTNESARCWCKLHPDAEDCAGVPEPELIRCETDEDAFRWNHDTDRHPFRLGGNSGTTVCADIDNDGAIDLLTTEIVHWDVGASSDPSELLLNSGEADVRFTRPGNEVSGLTKEHDRTDWNDGDMTAAVFDYDNDGWPDVWIGTSDYPGARGHLYRQIEKGRFVEVAPADGIDSKAAHGVAVADFDGDGDLDIVVGHSRARCEDQCYETSNVRYFENLAGAAGNWVHLQLEGGEGSNRAAIGARVEVTAGGVTRTQEISGGHGHYGIQHDLVAHFGLGESCAAEVRVIWPDAARTEQLFTVQAGYRYRVVQGQMPSAVR